MTATLQKSKHLVETARTSVESKCTEITETVLSSKRDTVFQTRHHGLYSLLGNTLFIRQTLSLHLIHVEGLVLSFVNFKLFDS